MGRATAVSVQVKLSCIEAPAGIHPDHDDRAAREKSMINRASSRPVNIALDLTANF